MAAVDGVAYLLGTRPLVGLGPQELGDRDDRLGVGVRAVLRELGADRLGEAGRLSRRWLARNAVRRLG